jgi:hypothetical protein
VLFVVIYKKLVVLNKMCLIKIYLQGYLNGGVVRVMVIPNYGWEVVNHSMLLQLRAESIQNKD